MIDRISISEADITTLQVDAIVNAANAALCGGGGVDGAIHRAAGPELLEECRQIGGCETGSAVITGAYHLPAKWVIHAVGPVWQGGERGEAELLRSAYRACLELAREHSAATIAFPAISCGAYRYPELQAARIAVRECVAFLAPKQQPTLITLCCFEPSVHRAYERAVQEVRAEL